MLSFVVDHLLCFTFVLTILTVELVSFLSYLFLENIPDLTWRLHPVLPIFQPHSPLPGPVGSSLPSPPGAHATCKRSQWHPKYFDCHSPPGGTFQTFPPLSSSLFVRVKWVSAVFELNRPSLKCPNAYLACSLTLCTRFLFVFVLHVSVGPWHG